MKCFAAVARHFRSLDQVSSDDVKSLLDKAIAAEADVAVIECLVWAVEKYEPSNSILLEGVFIPAIEFFTTRDDTRWIRGVWFLRQGKDFFRGLTQNQATLVTNNLLSLKRIDHEAETILTHIASAHPSLVWNFFAQRFEREPSDPLAYDAAPYQFHGLEQELSNDPAAALEAVWPMYRPDDPSFRFEGAQLLRAAFPDFPEAFANELLNILSSDSKIDFVLSILQNYEGAVAIHPVLQRIIELLPENSDHFTDIEICIESTGVVAGNFGFVEALRERKQQIESWLSDVRPAVVRFAERYIPRLETRIASQQRQAEQRREQRRRDYEGDEDQSGQPE